MNKTDLKLLSLIDGQLESIVSTGKLSGGSTYEAVDHLLHAKKSLLTIDAMESAGSSFDSRRGSFDHMGMRGGSYGEYADESSGRRYRDGMGRYASYDGYTSGREDMTHQLETLMRNATDENQRRAIEHAMREISNG